MIGGQVIDLEHEGTPVAEPVLRQLHSLKTSALIQAACEMGAAAAGADAEAMDEAGEFGLYLGLAFQIIDDILDVTGDQQVLGKPVGSDAQNQKTTYITLLGMEKCQKHRRCLHRARGESLQKIPDHDFLLRLTEQLLNRNF